jgi:hypothetical protein
MKDLTSTSFGYVIAFLLPGIVCVYGFTFLSDNIRSLLQPTLSGSATFISGLIALLAALTVGLLISGVRFLIFEKLLCRKHRLDAGTFERLVSSERFSVFKAVVDEHYRYHQFWGGFFIALIPLYIGWLLQQGESPSHLAICSTVLPFIAIELLAAYCAYDSYRKYVARSNDLNRIPSTSRSE